MLVASYAEQFGLKLLAWSDRHAKRETEDYRHIAYFLRNADGWYSEDTIYETYALALENADYDIELVTAYILGCNIGNVFQTITISAIMTILDHATNEPLESILIRDLAREFYFKNPEEKVMAIFEKVRRGYRRRCRTVRALCAWHWKVPHRWIEPRWGISLRLDKCPHLWCRAHGWRLESLSTRTAGGPILKMLYQLSSNSRKLKPKKTYRNPLIMAQELADDMNREGLTQSELARNQGLSRARVNQWLSLLKLPKKEIRCILVMEDCWSRQLITERQLRRSNKRSRYLGIRYL